MANEQSPQPASKRKPRGRGANHTGTSYHRLDGRWEWRVTLPNGKRRSFYGASETDARAKANAALRDQEAGIDVSRRSITVATFMTGWLKFLEDNEQVRPSTLAIYTRHVTYHISPTIGAVRLADLSPQHVEDMMANMVNKKGTAASTANRVRATLRNALQRAIYQKYVRDNAAALAYPRKERRERVKPLTPEQMEQFLAFVKDHRYGPLYAFAAYTGLRAGELLALRWEPDVEMEAGIVHVRHTLTKADKRGNRFGEPKTDDSERSLRLSDSAIEALVRQRLQVETRRALAGERWQELDLVFPNMRGGYTENPLVTRTLQQLLARAGLPKQRLHDFRHYYATTQLAEGADIFAVKTMLGHSQITLTSDTYGHLTRKLSDDAAKRIDQSRRRGDGLTTVFDAKQDDTGRDGE